MIGTVNATSNNNTPNSKITDNYITHTDIKQHDNTYTQKTQTKKENNIYVNKSSKITTETGTKTKPYKTINEKIINKLPIRTTINIANGKYKLNTINLNNNIKIIGQNKDKTILYTNSKTGLFNINTHSNLELINLTIRDYKSTISASINNNGTLTLKNLFFQNATRNINSAKGGFIYSTNNITAINCVFDNNKASYGACIYTNNSQTIIINSTFTNSETLNVGGALYCINSKTKIYNSKFMQNKAVSGAAIYNAFGNLTVKNTYFFKNDAQHFFGGAIYNTGRTITSNSKFIENHATLDGGAITNTNHFYSINCQYISNWATLNGGAIENIPVNKTEPGSLTLINNTFYENNAGNYGGVIINYNNHATLPKKSGIIKIINTKFLENTAYNGGIIYNERILNIKNATLKDNSAEEGNFIYMNNGAAKISYTKFKYKDIHYGNTKLESIDKNTVIIRKNKPNSNNKKINETNSTKKKIYKVTLHLTLKKVKASENVKKLYLKVIVKHNDKKLTTKNITLKIKHKQSKVKKLNSLKNFKFTITIKGKTYTSKTNKKGKIAYKISNINKKGKYNVKIIYKSNPYYENGKTIKFKIK